MYPLGEQFQFDYQKAKPNLQVVLRGKRYRISILTERLVRLEYHPNGTFFNAPTQLVIFRDFDLPQFSVKEDDRFLEVNTKYFKLEYEKEQPFKGPAIDPKKYFKITLKNTGKDIEKIWYYGHPEVRNFGGVDLPFDFPKGKNNPISHGLYSIDGFASIDDSKSKIILEDGTFQDREPGSFDIYVFCYKNDFLSALEDYYKLTGYPPLIPRYALGNWWSRNTNYDQETLFETVENFEKHNIPLSIVLLDKDWHIRETESEKQLVTGYTFENKLFSNPMDTISKLHDKNIKIGLNINPKQGIYPHEAFYDKACQYLGIVDRKIILFDPLNPKFLDVYMKLFLHPLESFGVDFFWNDYDENNTIMLWLLNHYQYLDSGRNKSKRHMHLSRGVGLALHRYPILYSGKTKVGWDMLRAIPWCNIMAANSGVSWLSHDIGGNYGGIEESELYIRYIELGVFSPILRFHSERGNYYKKEPWLWDVKTRHIVEDYLRLRHRLIPYLYTEAYLYHKNGTPIVRPFYYSNPWVYDDQNYRNQYYFGSEMLVSPILSKKDHVMNRTVHSFFIPEGVWYDFKTGKKFPGPNRYLAFFKEEDYPVFVQGGSIIPLSNAEEWNEKGNPKKLEIMFFPGKNNQYIMYEDDGESSLYKDGYFLKTVINSQYTTNSYKVTIQSIEGKQGIVPDVRDYKIRFRNTKKFNEVKVTFNDQIIDDVNFYVEDNDSIVEVKNIPTIGKLVMECLGQDVELDAVRLINEDINSILMDLQIETVLKEKIAEVIFSDLPMNRKRINIRKLKRHGLESQHIKLFLKLLEYIEQI